MNPNYYDQVFTKETTSYVGFYDESCFFQGHFKDMTVYMLCIIEDQKECERVIRELILAGKGKIKNG